MKIEPHQHAAALAALYNRARPQGLGHLQHTLGDMAVEEAQKIIDDGRNYFDYLGGRSMKIEICDDLDFRLYDRDNGPEAGATAVSAALGVKA